MFLKNAERQRKNSADLMPSEKTYKTFNSIYIILSILEKIFHTCDCSKKTGRK